MMIYDLSSVSTFVHTQEVLGSNIGRDIGYGESGFFVIYFTNSGQIPVQ
jgi:hypothetical protein